MRLLLLLLLLPLAACSPTPRTVTIEEVDQAAVMGRPRAVCRGLDMADDAVRRFAAEKIAPNPDPDLQACLCAHVLRDGAWDAAVLSGLEGSERDDLADCFADLLDRPGTDRPDALVEGIAATRAPAVKARLQAFAARPGDDRARAAAVKALAGPMEPDRATFLLGLLSSDPAPAVRAAAATALGGRDDPTVAGALRTAFEQDAAAEVRFAAMESLGGTRAGDLDALQCQALLHDPDPRVRRAAILNFKGTRSERAIACLRERAFSEEPDGEVRQALLDTLKSSPHEGAAAILCDAIPFFLEHYVKDDIPQMIPGTLITIAQNDRDWPRSLECAQKAHARASRYDCYGRQHIANWVRELGGSARAPRCPKTDGPTAIYRQREDGTIERIEPGSARPAGGGSGDAGAAQGILSFE